MSYTIKVLQVASTGATPAKALWIRSYTPPHPADRYGTGHLELTDKPERALRFPDSPAAFKFWKQQYGRRRDGKPNRPLTAFTVEISADGDPRA
jgi:hypothetical protein